MALRIVVPGFVLACLAIAAAAAEPARPARLAQSECLDPGRARSWHLIDQDEILVDAGRRHFHLKLSFSCPELTWNHTIGFRAANGIGRVCGHFGDAIITPRPGLLRSNCLISVVTPLNKAQFDGYLEHRDQSQTIPGPTDSTPIVAPLRTTNPDRVGPR